MQEEGFTLSVLEEGKDMMKKREVTLIGDRRRLEKEEPRVEFGISLLETALKETGYGCLWAEAPEHPWEYLSLIHISEPTRRRGLEDGVQRW